MKRKEKINTKSTAVGFKFGSNLYANMGETIVSFLLSTNLFSS